MIFADLVAGDAVFVDANSFIYHFAPDPVLGPPCRATGRPWAIAAVFSCSSG
jgi:hypothetical protein